MQPTCGVCGSKDGTVAELKKAKVGTNIPPFHPNCRGCVLPYFDDEYFKEGQTRTARDESGRNHTIDDMTYSEWKEKFVIAMDNQNAIDKPSEDDIIKIGNDKFHCYGDYLREKLGSAVENNHEEFLEIKKDVESKGGKIVLLSDSTKMVCNMRKGEPGVIEVDENISIAGLKHEYRHFLDDMENGNPGLAYYLQDRSAFFEYEKRGYEEELKIAVNNGFDDIAEKIKDEIEKRRREIFGNE